jgi:Tfp pilus assembly protein PilV
MVAFVVLGIGLLAVAGAQVKAVHGTKNGRHLSQAVVVAHTQLEQLTRSSWTSLAPTGGWTAPVQVVTNVEDGSGGTTEQAYSVTWRTADSIPNETRAIDIRVSWTESSGRNRAVAASTMRFNREDL